MATELVKGKTIQEALSITNKVVVDALDGLPSAKLHCSVLAEQGIKAAIQDYYEKKGIDPLPIIGCDLRCSDCSEWIVQHYKKKRGNYYEHTSKSSRLDWEHAFAGAFKYG